MVRVPRGVRELSRRLGTATDGLTGIGRPPTVAELARHPRVGEEEVLDARAALAAHSPPSLDEPISDDSEPAALGELVGGGDGGGMGLVEDAVPVEHDPARLPPRNREVLPRRVEQDLPRREIGARLGVSQIHLSRLIRQSLERLQGVAAEESALPPPAGRAPGDHRRRRRTARGRP